MAWRQPSSSRGWELALLLAAFALATVVYAVKYLPLLPNGQGGIGGDYAMFLPDMLAAYYWILHNGYWAIPWFSPAECGGVPFFADPQVAYFSVPQLLTLWVPPLRAVQAMFLLFASAGFFGTYVLARVSFRLSVPAALLAAVLFMFNAFYVSRILIGHMTFHAFMLLPAAAAALLRPPGAGGARLPGTLLRLCIAAASLAYMVQAGSFVILLPMLGSLLLVLLLHAACFGWRCFPLASLVASSVFALLLSAGKLAAVLALLAQFPRDNYPLPGFASLWSDLGLAFMTVFFWVPADAAHAIVNTRYVLERHEWEYAVSPVPLLLMAAAVLAAVLRRRRLPLPLSRVLLLAAVMLLLAMPVALNWYQPGWNAFLKALPLIGSSSNMLRWFCIYILPAVLGGALALDALCTGTTWFGGRAALLAAAGIAGVLGLAAAKDMRFYDGQGVYQAAAIDTAYRQAAATGVVPPVTAVAVQTDGAAHVVMTPQRNDILTQGYSQLLCYQPLFGYQLERFPLAPLHPGLALDTSGHLLNLKDPSCYLFPGENQCRPGDQFDVLVRGRAVAFLDYRPYPFASPFYARAANWVSGIAFLALIGALLLAVSLLCGARLRRAAPAGAA